MSEFLTLLAVIGLLAYLPVLAGLAFAVGRLFGLVDSLTTALDRREHTWSTLEGLQAGQFKMGVALHRVHLLRELVIGLVQDDAAGPLIDLLDAVEVALKTGQQALVETSKGPTAYRDERDA